MTTLSESLFIAYCGQRGYACERIEEAQTERRADFEVVTGDTTVLVEIKEFTPNPEDREQARSMRERGEAGGTFDGLRIRGAIEKAAGQLRRARTTAQPAVLLLHDNIVVDGVRPYMVNYVFNPTLLEWGMYGDHVAVFEVPAHGRAIDCGDKRGGNRQLMPDARNYISAVLLLTRGTDGPYVWAFHNFFAKTKLPRSAFSGPGDRHFRNPSDPLTGPVGWENF